MPGAAGMRRRRRRSRGAVRRRQHHRGRLPLVSETPPRRGGVPAPGDQRRREGEHQLANTWDFSGGRASLEQTNPRWVLLQLGTNDVRIDGDATSVERFRENLDAILDVVAGHRNPDGSSPRVLLATIPPVPVEIAGHFNAASRAPGRPRRSIRRYARSRRGGRFPSWTITGSSPPARSCCPGSTRASRGTGPWRTRGTTRSRRFSAHRVRPAASTDPETTCAPEGSRASCSPPPSRSRCCCCSCAASPGRSSARASPGLPAPALATLRARERRGSLAPGRPLSPAAAAAAARTWRRSCW